MGLDRAAFLNLIRPTVHDAIDNRGLPQIIFYYTFCCANENTLLFGSSVSGTEI